MSICTFIASNAPLPSVAPLHHYPLHINVDLGTVEDGGTDDNYFLHPFLNVRDYTDMHILGATRDDAAGECFDKAARVLGLPYPGGRPMDELAQKSAGGVYKLPQAHVEDLVHINNKFHLVI